MKRGKKMWKETLSILGKSYELTMRWKRLWLWGLLILAIDMLVFKFYERNMAAGITQFRVGLSALVAPVLALLHLWLFFYIVGLFNKKRGFYFKSAVLCLKKPFFVGLLLLSFTYYLFLGSSAESPLLILVVLTTMFSMPIVAFGTGAIKQGFLDLFLMWRRFWLAALTWFVIVCSIDLVVTVIFGVFFTMFLFVTLKALAVEKLVSPAKIKEYVGVISPIVTFVVFSIGILVWNFALIQMYKKLPKSKRRR